MRPPELIDRQAGFDVRTALEFVFTGLEHMRGIGKRIFDALTGRGALEQKNQQLTLELGTTRERLSEALEREELRTHQLIRVREEAAHDPLTGLKNFQIFLEEVQQRLAFDKRNKFDSTMLFLDLDEFKEVNDTFGHAIADKILIHFSNLLTARTRDGDIVTRRSGDEFCLYVENISPLNLTAFLSELYKTFERKPFELDDGTKILIRVSIGAHWIRSGTSISSHEAVNAADAAMSLAKKSGKNQSHVTIAGVEEDLEATRAY